MTKPTEPGKKPTEPGWYWILYPTGRKAIVEVRHIGKTKTLRVVWTPINDIQGQWGPKIEEWRGNEDNQGE